MTATSDTQPGSARAPGPSVADTLRSDSIAPPPPLLEQSYQFLGDAEIPFSRYTDTTFFQSEMEKLWPKSWQWACREEHIPDVGDHYVYDIGKWSVIVVRAEDNVIRAFLNVCSHRGTRILSTEGAGYSQSLTCPFHGWSWDLNGQLTQLPGRWDFPHVSDASHGLDEVSCERWGGFVFINIDPQAATLDNYLDCLPDHFKHFPLEQRRIKLHVEKVLPCNWKAAQEAFMEAYHNVETHNAPNGANAQYDIFGKYVSRFIHTIGSYSPESLADYAGDRWRSPPLTETEQLQALGVTDAAAAEQAEQHTARAVAAAIYREQMSADMGVDLSACSDSLMLDSIEYHLFPNMFFFPGISIPMCYRFRPNGMDTDTCIFDLMLLEPIAEGAEHQEPPEPIKLSIDQSYTEAEGLSWLAPVYDEDTGNLQMQQQGFKTSTRGGVTLGNYQESRIRRVHMTLDEFLDAPVTEA
ncbi:aromatic ring-hydroxylating oxygenase subunit alpha [Candidatus Litorirhabdus singularis]|uniref:aromatic ring-hydroxylating oxygenase subunit alpha n=1 Tax=Candidatus Litorirhabdus singularis TaxID=2518993 RepID=UPI00242F3689|nr:aromatic ring-hydroxylating dioxygenase subunit alpha [Candidatus Litorirhabdus singularis]